MFWSNPGVVALGAHNLQRIRTLRPSTGQNPERTRHLSRVFLKTSCFPWGSDGFLERRIHGKNREVSPRKMGVSFLGHPPKLGFSFGFPLKPQERGALKTRHSQIRIGPSFG